MPLTPPKVESATATGTRKAAWPYRRPAKVWVAGRSVLHWEVRWTVTDHGHGLGAQDLGHGQRGVEGDVGGDVDHGDEDAGDADGPGEVSDGVLHLLDHVVQVVPAVVGEEAWRNSYLGHNKS